MSYIIVQAELVCTGRVEQLRHRCTETVDDFHECVKREVVAPIRIQRLFPPFKFGMKSMIIKNMTEPPNVKNAFPSNRTSSNYPDICITLKKCSKNRTPPFS